MQSHGHFEDHFCQFRHSPLFWLQCPSGSAQLEGIDLNNRTSNSQNHLLSQESDSAHSLHLETARTGTHRGSLETQESSRLTVASRSSPSSPLKELSGKLMKSKCVVCLSLSCFCFYNLFRGFPGGPVAKIAETKCRGPGSDPWLRSSRSLPHATIRSVAAKQIKINIFLKIYLQSGT